MKRALIIALVACSSVRSKQHVDFARLSFDVPGDWTHHDKVFKGVATTIWTPDSNANHESLTIIRSEIAPATTRANEAQLGELLRRAQSFAGTRVSSPVATTTPSGFRGSRLEVDYVPPGQHERYHRVHVVLVDGSSLVHIMYTARSADPQLDALGLVLGSIREGEG